MPLSLQRQASVEQGPSSTANSGRRRRGVFGPFKPKLLIVYFTILTIGVVLLILGTVFDSIILIILGVLLVIFGGFSVFYIRIAMAFGAIDSESSRDGSATRAAGIHVSVTQSSHRGFDNYAFVSRQVEVSFSDPPPLYEECISETRSWSPVARDVLWSTWSSDSQDGYTDDDTEPPPSYEQAINTEALPGIEAEQAVSTEVVPDIEVEQAVSTEAVPDIEAEQAVSTEAVPDIEAEQAVSTEAVPDIEAEQAVSTEAVPDMEAEQAVSTEAVPDIEADQAVSTEAVPDIEADQAVSTEAVPDIEADQAAGTETVHRLYLIERLRGTLNACSLEEPDARNPSRAHTVEATPEETEMKQGDILGVSHGDGVMPSQAYATCQENINLDTRSDEDTSEDIRCEGDSSEDTTIDTRL